MKGYPMERILAKLDEYTHKNDYAAAERHLLYWLEEKRGTPVALTLYNELLGIYRKTAQEEKAFSTVKNALQNVENLGLSDTVTAATTYLNAATVLHAFSRADEGLPLFEKAKGIYERELSPSDTRLGGLYNNMGTALVTLGRFADADVLYKKAISIMQAAEDGDLEVAVTLLNMASAVEAEKGTLDGEEEISSLLGEARTLLEKHERRDGYYAFVASKCAPVYRYFGHFRYAKELEERSERIYEGA